MTNFILKIVGILGPVWKRAGVNKLHLQAILRAKLTMDKRRDNNLFNQKSSKSNQQFSLLFANGFMGLLMGTIFLGKINPEVQFLIYHSALLVFFTLIIISEFSTILFDTKDNLEILSRPVDAKTFYTSRVAHIVIYLLTLGIPLSVGGIVISGIKFGIATSGWLFFLILLDILIASFLANLFYMAIIRFSSAARLKTVIMYVQVLLVITIYGGYQLIPKLYDSETVRDATLSSDWWMYLIPSVWPAKGSILFITDNLAGVIPAIITNIFFPLVGLLAIIKYFAPFYNQKLSEIEGVAEKKKTYSSKKPGKKSFLINLFKVSNTEKANYELIRIITSKDLQFKQGVYSILGFMLVIFLIPVISEFNNLNGFVEELANSSRYFIPLAAVPIICLMIYAQMQYTNQTTAVWIFKFLPIKNPGEIIVSAVIVTLLKYFLPISVITLIILLLVWPLSILAHVVMVWGISVLSFSFFVCFSPKYLPLSRNKSLQNSAQNIGQVFLLLFLGGAVGAAMYGLSKLPDWVNYLAGIIAIFAFLIFLKKMRTISWSSIQL